MSVRELAKGSTVSSGVSIIYLYYNTYNGVTAVSFQFTHVGRDPSAARLWMDLGQDTTVGEFIDVFGLGHWLEDKWTVVCHNWLFSNLISFKLKPH